MAFRKGQSGNPGGRPKETGHVRELARQHTGESIATLAAIMGDKSENARARVAAAEALLDRAWGRPAQSHTLEVDAGGKLLSLIEAGLARAAKR